MQKTLPKGHTSCLSSKFKYTSASHTDVGQTFARVKRQLTGQPDNDRAWVERVQASNSPLLNARTPNVHDERIHAAASL
jgi:hypothetical protein